jgi:osmotically-inducible protein OsmY
MIRKSDHQRGGFIHFYFDRDWNDPLGYDLVFNTSRVSQNAIVESIVAAAKDPRLKQAESEAKEILEDIIVCKKVEAELLKSGKVGNSHFKIESHGGELFISGHVHSEAEKSKAIKIIGKVEGVRRVEDDLQVVSYKPYKE